jgi:urease accessory protein
VGRRPARHGRDRARERRPGARLPRHGAPRLARPWLERWAADLARDGVEPAYAVAVGVVAARSGVPLRPTAAAYLHALAANLVSAAVRLVPLGQTDGQRALAALEPAILAATEAAPDRPLAAVGSAIPVVEWASMRHETQYTRLFRS